MKTVLRALALQDRVKRTGTDVVPIAYLGVPPASTGAGNWSGTRTRNASLSLADLRLRALMVPGAVPGGNSGSPGSGYGIAAARADGMSTCTPGPMVGATVRLRR